MRLIDLDDDRNCYCGECGEYKHWDIDPSVLPKSESFTTHWTGNHTPYRCVRCGHYTDSKTPYCAWCGRKAVNYD